MTDDQHTKSMPPSDGSSMPSPEPASFQLSPADQPRTEASLRQTVADTYRELGLLDESMPHEERALEVRRRVLGDDDPHTLISKCNLALRLVELGNASEAERLAGEAVETARATLGPEHWLLGNFLGKHGRALAALERFDEAESALLESHGILVAALSSDHKQSSRVIGYLADLYDAWGKPELAAEYRPMLPVEQKTQEVLRDNDLDEAGAHHEPRLDASRRACEARPVRASPSDAAARILSATARPPQS